MPSDYIIVESSGTPLLEQVMVFVIKTIGKSTSEITAILSSLPPAAMAGSVAIAEDASTAWMKGLDGTWNKIGIDSTSSALSCIGIVANGNAAPFAISAGQYVIWQGALYTASANIPSGGTLSSSNLSAVSGGGLNALNSQIAVLPFVSNTTLGNDNAGFHNSIYRGKNLGSALTAAQSEAIQAGTFDDLFIGDYWVINGRTHTIADFDTYINIGDSIAGLTNHHVAVVSSGTESSKWYDTNDTSRGYVSTDAGTIRKYIKDTVEPAIIADFGSSHVLTYRTLFPTAYSNGVATGWAFADARTELMSETDVFGHQVWAANGAGNPYEESVANRQLSIFRLKPDFMHGRYYWWLRTVCTATEACLINSTGSVGKAIASDTNFVRTFSLIQ